MTLNEEIAELKGTRRAVILAHNYTRAEVQAVADFTGDSLELARRATRVDAPVIVFCGVSFMAETAAVLNPDKTVLSPDPSAGCPMAEMIDGPRLRALKTKYPDAKVLCYVNSTAEVKAESDLCVTSANADRVAASLPPDTPVLFVPDQHLGGFTAKKLGRDFILWNGFCPIHARLTVDAIEKARAAHPDAPLMVHPECAREIRDRADQVLSTGGMCAWVKTSPAREFIVGTETGILWRLRTENPDKVFHPLQGNAVCADMKKITLEKVRDSLRDLQTPVTVDPNVAARARAAIGAMLALG